MLSRTFLIRCIYWYDDQLIVCATLICVNKHIDRYGIKETIPHSLHTALMPASSWRISSTAASCLSFRLAAILAMIPPSPAAAPEEVIGGNTSGRPRTLRRSSSQDADARNSSVRSCCLYAIGFSGRIGNAIIGNRRTGRHMQRTVYSELLHSLSPVV